MKRSFKEIARTAARYSLKGDYFVLHAARQPGKTTLLQAFCQRVVNGGAVLVREFALGRSAVDICINYAGTTYLVEMKLAGHGSREKALTARLKSRLVAPPAPIVSMPANPGMTIPPGERSISSRTGKLPLLLTRVVPSLLFLGSFAGRFGRINQNNFDFRRFTGQSLLPRQSEGAGFYQRVLEPTVVIHIFSYCGARPILPPIQ